MVIEAILWSVIAVILLSTVVLAALAWLKVPERTVDDILDYVVPVDLEKLEALLDPAVEYSFRMYLSPKDFRRLQIKRVHQFLELLRRISRNSAILIDYANRECDQKDPAVLDMALKLREEATALRLYALVALLTVRSWLLLRSRLPFRSNARFSLPELRERHGVCVVDTYRRFKDAALTLYSQRRPNTIEQLAQSL